MAKLTLSTLYSLPGTIVNNKLVLCLLLCCLFVGCGGKMDKREQAPNTMRSDNSDLKIKKKTVASGTMNIAPASLTYEAIISIDSGAQVLAAYEIGLVFDPSTIKIVSIDGGNNPYFAGKPFYASNLIQTGNLKLANLQSDEKRPHGIVQLVKIRYQQTDRNHNPFTAIIQVLSDPFGKQFNGTLSIKYRKH